MPSNILIAIFLAGAAVEFCWCAFLRSSTGLRLFADIPNERSSHTVPVPRSAGAAFAPALALAAIVSTWFLNLDWKFAILASAGILLLAGVGMVDDLRSLHAGTRLLAHIISSLLVFASTISFLPPEVHLQSGIALAALIWTFVSVASINLFNFADGINGFIGLTGLLPITAFALIHGNQSQVFFWPVTAMGVSVCGSLVVFTEQNFLRRKVFMGDAGSTVLGLWQALLMIVIASTSTPQTSSSLFCYDLLASIVLFISVSGWIFLDCGTMVPVKLLRGMPLSQPHRQHMYQRLSRRPGWSHTSATATIFAAQVLLAGISIALWLNLTRKSYLLTMTCTLAVLSALFFYSNWKAIGAVRERKNNLS